MRLGMMQPYFFPYLGYFGLIAATDRWIVFDTAQYIRRGWVNRNRVLSTSATGWKYLRIPTAAMARTDRICDIRIAQQSAWRDDSLRNLDEYKLRRAPYFQETRDFLADTFAACDGSVCDMLVHCLRAVCEYVGLEFCGQRFSSLKLPIDEVCSPGDWALQVSRAIGAQTYINPPGGRQLFDAQAFAASGIALQFLTHRLPEYDQHRPQFVPGLSVIDVLMWNGPQRTRALIDEYDIEPALPVVDQAA